MAMMAVIPCEFASTCGDKLGIQMPGTDNTERIAIVGVGGIFPGAPDLATFWTNISTGIDAGRDV